MGKTVWPKQISPLSAEQKRISDDFMKYWHEVLPKQYSLVDRFNHFYSVKNAPRHFQRTLEIGAGIGEHLCYEKLTPEQERNYYALDVRETMGSRIKERFPNINVLIADCQQPLDFPDGYFDRILAIHVLEHLPNLPAAVKELYRLCDKDCGHLSVVIPCEGSLAYLLARRISAQRIFEQRYQQSYKWFIEREHINRPREITGVLTRYFEPVSRRFFPLRLPLLFCNLVIGMTLKPKKGCR